VEKVPVDLAETVRRCDFCELAEGVMAGDEVIATLDVAPELLAEFGSIIGALGKVVGSAECENAVRSKIVVPAELGSCVQAIAEKTRGSIAYRLVPAT
jgi:hypothetical protein